MTEKIIDQIKNCDSWSKVEDQGDAIKHGRYAVTVFFDTDAEAAEFEGSIRDITSRP